MDQPVDAGAGEGRRCIAVFGALGRRDNGARPQRLRLRQDRCGHVRYRRRPHWRR